MSRRCRRSWARTKLGLVLDDLDLAAALVPREADGRAAPGEDADGAVAAGHLGGRAVGDVARDGRHGGGVGEVRPVGAEDLGRGVVGADHAARGVVDDDARGDRGEDGLEVALDPVELLDLGLELAVGAAELGLHVERARLEEAVAVLQLLEHVGEDRDRLGHVLVRGVEHHGGAGVDGGGHGSGSAATLRGGPA